MPLYEYNCPSCSSVSEIHHKMSDPNPTECPKCGGGPLSKLISRTNFSLKGGGWYNDGYGGKSSKGSNTATPAAETKTDVKTPEKSKEPAETPAAPKTETPSKASGAESSHACSGGGCAYH